MKFQSSLTKRSKFRFIPSIALSLVPKIYDFNRRFHNSLNWRLFYEYAIRGDEHELVGVILHGRSHPIYLRRGTTDITNFVSVFLLSEYDFINHKCESIFDLGGYIGLSSYFFASRFPNATIIVVEPDPENYALCVLNNRSNPNVKVINCAVWNESVALAESSRRYGHMSVSLELARASDSNVSEIEGVTVEALMKKFNIEFIDFLKVDIEGAERFVFDSPRASEWLSKVHSMSVEIHESKYPGCDKAVFGAAENIGFKFLQKGEYTYFYK